MPNDAKLGLVVGVTAVIVLAVLFFRRELPAGPERGGRASSLDPRGARTIPPAPRPPRSHRVGPGETLGSLAAHYYGDSQKSSILLEANRERLPPVGPLPVGLVLYVPDAGQD